MVQSLSKKDPSPDDPLTSLRKEIAALDAELERLKKDLSPFETAIHTRLAKEIGRVRDLSGIYKQQKAEKKAKRLEQKKRGKNYKEPKQLLLNRKKEEGITGLTLTEQKELKRIYKEAIVQVHPDKFNQSEDEKIRQATALTVRLNKIYKGGDLDELMNFYETIIGGNELTYIERSSEPVADPKARIASLKRKKEALANQLEQLKSSYLYHILTSYENPFSFIDELQIQFQERIKQLEKRTRKRLS